MWVGRVTPATVALLAGRRQSQWASGGCEWCCSRASTPSPPLPHTHTDKKNSLHTEKVSLHVVIIPILPDQFILDKSALYACAETFFCWCPSLTLVIHKADMSIDAKFVVSAAKNRWDVRQENLLTDILRRLSSRLCQTPSGSHSDQSTQYRSSETGDWASSRSTGNSVSKTNLRMEAARRKHKQTTDQTRARCRWVTEEIIVLYLFSMAIRDVFLSLPIGHLCRHKLSGICL